MAKATKSSTSVIAGEIVSRIYKVMLDFDLAVLYEVETKALNQSVKRNIERFPEDFMFKLDAKEWQLMRSQFATASTQSYEIEDVVNMRSQNATASSEVIEKQTTANMRSQFVTTSQKKRNTAVTPYAFTEHGVAMLASVLKSERAIKMSIAVVRAFTELKKSASQFKELAEQLDLIKQHLGEHDAQLDDIYTAIENLLDEKMEKELKQETWENRKRIGFK